MADTVHVRALLDTADRYVVELKNKSDGTGEAGVVKVDASALNADHFQLKSIWHSNIGMGVLLEWDGTTPERLIELPADDAGWLGFPSGGYLDDPKVTGHTGDIKLTTINHAAGDAYFIVMDLVKVTS